jgi:PTH1 family peptidyl-tRNA hydrolase
MRLLVGLGNPGEKYKNNRHNVGFKVVEAIARQHDFGAPRRRFRVAEATEGQLGGEQVMLFKPGTFMNDSGLSVADAVNFYKLKVEDVVVFHDEIELPFAKVRVKIGGSDAGHNGLRSISAHVGKEYWRVRIGVGHPGVKDLVHYYVLSDFTKAEQPWVKSICEVIADNADLVVRGKDSSFQNKVHLAMEAKGFDPASFDRTRPA